jgi:hypothetical protein
VSADQRAIIIRNGDEISRTFSTGYTGEGDDFGWIIPTPIPPDTDDVIETGGKGEAAFKALDHYTAPQFITPSRMLSCAPKHIPSMVASHRDRGTRHEGTTCDLATGEWVLSTVLAIAPLRDMVTIRPGAVVTSHGQPSLLSRWARIASRSFSRCRRGTGMTGRGDGGSPGLQAGDALAAKRRGMAITSLEPQETTEVYNSTSTVGTTLRCIEQASWSTTRGERSGALPRRSRSMEGDRTLRCQHPGATGPHLQDWPGKRA